MSKPDGGPAFPHHFKALNGETMSKAQGMSLRDYFAAEAMKSVLNQKDAHDGREWTNAAWIAYQVADAMLAERDK
jgi:hypothetical protein